MFLQRQLLDHPDRERQKAEQVKTVDAPVKVTDAGRSRGCCQIQYVGQSLCSRQLQDQCQQ